ncbi:MAG: hypothetical protein K8W52_32955, partial [Deltaproteobacteria bacterium]|nr:hypothetical protein [Deltaproteobacteria bacterium]
LGLSAQSAAATTPPPPPPPPPVVAPTIAPDPPAPLTAYVRGAAFGDLGTVPLGALGAGLGAGFAVGPWGARIGAIWMPARFARIADTEVGLDVGLLAGQLAGCRRALAGVWLCAGLELGGMRGDPVGLVDGAPTVRAWFAADLTVSRTIALTDRTSLVGAVEGIGALVRPRFVLDDGTEVFVPSSIAGRAMIGLEIRLR